MKYSYTEYLLVFIPFIQTLAMSTVNKMADEFHKDHREVRNRKRFASVSSVKTPFADNMKP